MSKSAHRQEGNGDDAQLAALGHTAELERNFSFFSMLGLAYAIPNSWPALAASLSLALPSGGPVSVIWGLVTSGFCNLCVAASLAEFLSAYPISAGQYYWVAAICWNEWVPVMTWITGWINTTGWIALTATAGLLGSQLMTGIIAFYKPSYEPEKWHQFLLYTGYIVVAVIINVFGTRALPLLNKAAFIWSLAGFAIVGITLLVCAAPDYQPADVVYTKFINTTGWPDGIAWLLGLLQGSLGLAGFDAVAHMIEEIPNPKKEGPRTLLASILMGIITGFIFLSILLFVLKDIDTVISSPAGPLLQIFYDSTGSKVGSVCLMVVPLMCFLFASVSLLTTSSRMTYAFARDKGLPLSATFARVHRGLGLPLPAIFLTAIVDILLGCLFLGSTSAFNAVASASIVALGVSYAIPIVILCLRGRRILPEDRIFKLPNTVGWVLNLISIAFLTLTTVLFVFPPALPVSAASMNYCIAAFAVIILISTFQWIVDGRKNFNGPLVAPHNQIEGVGEDSHVEGNAHIGKK
ncbi:hypothetical protein NW755_012313 [Fusarium falciforme]|uniref:Amino acid permease n=1 Tax=Fusarium falciforme TaxID=195108 RepID=A0A9W8QXU5_9HYPO|nr:hypothetical protein NW755_012313 [Fusarium falciforme]